MIKLKAIIALLLIQIFFISNSIAMPAAGPGCNQPFSPCWCLNHPGACNNQVPINNELWILLAAGVFFGIYIIKKRKLVFN